MQPTCCDAGADATGVTTDAADGSTTDGADVSVISDADASLDVGPPPDEGGRSDIAEVGPLADVDRDAPPPIVDGTPPADGPDGLPPTDGPVDNPACPLRNPDPVVCADPDAGSPETRWVECTPLNPRTVATASYPGSFKMDTQGIYWTAGFGEIYMLSNGASSPTMIVKARAVTSFHGFQLDDNAIYFDDETDGGRFTVTSIRRDGTARTALATSARGSLAIDGERLYIGDDGGRVAWIPKSGGMPVATPMPLPERRLFLHDDTHFYWFEGPADDRTLKRWARDGVSSETNVDQQGSDFWMLQDATHL